MKSAIRLLIVFLGVPVACLALSCNSNNAVTMVGVMPVYLAPAQITTSVQGGQAVSQVNQAKELIYNSTEILESLGILGIRVMTTDPTLANTATPVSCSDYGQFTYAGSVAAGTFHLTLTFDLCRMNGYQFDNVYTLSGTPANFTVTLGSSTEDYRIVDFTDRSYSAIKGTMALSGLRFTMAGTIAPLVDDITLTMTGRITSFDYVLLRQFIVTMSNLSSKYTSTVDAGTLDKATTVLANGRLTQSWGSGGLSLTYTDLLIAKDEFYLSTTPTGIVYSGSDTTVNGTVGFTMASAVTGLLSVVTSTANPIHHDYATGLTTAGTMTVSGAGAAVASFNAPGSISVVVAPDVPVSFSKEYFLNHAAKFFSMEKVLPTYVGTTGPAASAAAAGTTWPATMTVTALSSAPTSTDLGCYTDVHVNYYNPTDYAAVPPAVTWHIDWDVSGGCTNPLGIPFQQALNVTTPDSSCDVGLDINGSATDVTSGGVEHFTADTLPQGYYVISINNYSCDSTKVTNMASIIVGDYLFGPYNCAYSGPADKDSLLGTVVLPSGAWCRLADMQVNAGGSVDILAPDMLIDPRHN